MTDRKQWKTGLSIGRVSQAALEHAAKAQLDVVEISCIENDDPNKWKEIPAWSASTGVQVWSIHLPFRGNAPVADPATWDPEYWKQTYDQDKYLIEHAAEGGVKVAVIHPSLEPIPGYLRESQMRAAIQHLGELSDVCKKGGMTLAIEDLPRTCLGNCSDEMLRLMESNSDLRICFDVNHLLKEDHETFVEKVGKYIITTHISDYDFVDEKHWFPMQGQINWRVLQAALEKADYNGPFLYETMPMGHTWEDVRPNHEKLKAL